MKTLPSPLSKLATGTVTEARCRPEARRNQPTWRHLFSHSGAVDILETDFETLRPKSARRSDGICCRSQRRGLGATCSVRPQAHQTVARAAVDMHVTGGLLVAYRLAALRAGQRRIVGLRERVSALVRSSFLPAAENTFGRDRPCQPTVFFHEESVSSTEQRRQPVTSPRLGRTVHGRTRSGPVAGRDLKWDTAAATLERPS